MDFLPSTSLMPINRPTRDSPITATHLASIYNFAALTAVKCPIKKTNDRQKNYTNSNMSRLATGPLRVTSTKSSVLTEVLINRQIHILQ